MKDREQVDPSAEYMKRFEKRLRIKDPSTREQILTEIGSRVLTLERKGRGLDQIVSAMGPPEEVAETLSNPDNWFVDMGTPTSPLVPVESFISQRGRIMLMLAFLLALFLSSMMVLTGEFGLLVPVILAFSITLWALMAAWLNQFLGYMLTYRKMQGGEMKTLAISRSKMSLSVWKHYLFAIILSMVLMISPVIFDRDSLFFSVPLGSITVLGSITMAILIIIESRKILDEE